MEPIAITTYDERKAAMIAHHIPGMIKHRGRWCALRRIDDSGATYAAPAKEMRAAWRRHQPVTITLTLSEARTAGKKEA